MRDKVLNCPDCGSPMVERYNSKTGQKFYGCSRYPQCRMTLGESAGKGKIVAKPLRVYCEACGEPRSLNARGLCTECQAIWDRD